MSKCVVSWVVVWLPLVAAASIFWEPSSAAATAVQLQASITDTQTVSPTPPTVLPAPLFLIDPHSGQVVRVETDGVERRTVTHETMPVTALDVAPDGSKLVYVSGNRLIETAANGLNRVVKYETGARIGNPVYSPNGAQIAFAHEGVNLIPSGPEAGADAVTLLVANDPVSAGDFDPKARSYSPVNWSPNGKWLLVEYRYGFDTSGLILLDPKSDAQVHITVNPDLTILESPQNGEVVWQPDSRGFYVASAMYVYATAGLSWVNAATGQLTSVITTSFQAPTASLPDPLVHGPHVNAANALHAFVWEVAELPPGPEAYRLVAIDPVSGARTALNDEIYNNMQQTLWAHDDSGALLLTDHQYTSVGLTGALNWAAMEGRPVQPIAYGSSPRWGSPKFGAPPPEIAEVVALFEQTLEMDRIRAKEGPGVFEPSTAYPVQLEDGTTYWVAHTTGVRAFSPDQPHVVGVYVRAEGDWREVSLLELVDVQEGAATAPDYLADAGVMPVQIGPTTTPAVAGDKTVGRSQLWLRVEGVVGAHSGVCTILRLVDGALTPELGSFSPSPGACAILDVNGDGANEVVLNATDPYVFCYACGVQFQNYTVMRWNGEKFDSVDFAPLPASAPAELARYNDEIVRLAQAGLWKGALTLLDPNVMPESIKLALTSSVTDTAILDQVGGATETRTVTSTVKIADDVINVFNWNKALVTLTGEARRSAAWNPEHPYPLLAHVFYGDYSGAVDIMRVYSATQVFAHPSALVTGTVAGGWEGTLAAWITSTATLAVEADPELAAAYFLRGWGAWLGGATAAANGEQPPTGKSAPEGGIDQATLDTAVADIRRAYELDPQPFYAESLILLTGEG